MKTNVRDFGLRCRVEGITPDDVSFRPPSWPPSDDWVISRDRRGRIISRYGDDRWDLSPWAGKSFIINIVKGKSKTDVLDEVNAGLLRLFSAWFLWGPLSPRTLSTFKTSHFGPIRRVIAFCRDHKIPANQLSRYPELQEKLAALIPSSMFGITIAALHRLWEYRDSVGSCLLSCSEIEKLALAAPEHEGVQIAYIPPRLWFYQSARLLECLEEFKTHQSAIEDCFKFCVVAYENSSKSSQPFNRRKNLKNPGVRSGSKFLGSFEEIAGKFGIAELILRWIKLPKDGWNVRLLSSYLTLVVRAGRAYLVHHTFQRIEEAMSLRSDCLKWEWDEKFGKIPIICGETTKTNPDSDARWPTSPVVEIAVSSMTAVTRLRMICADKNKHAFLSESDAINPHLNTRIHEPWMGTGTKNRPNEVRIGSDSYREIIRRFPLLFDAQVIKVTPDDLRIAATLTPEIDRDDRFSVGKAWPYSWHQLRRTGAVNMFSSGILSDTSLQFLMKHSTRLMPLYYGRNFTKLRFNEEVSGLVIAAMYEMMAKKLKTATSDRYVSPYGEKRKNSIIINLVGSRDAKALAEAGRKGETTFREIRLGACTKIGPCEYGGIESVARCGGGDGKSACSDVLYDRDKELMIREEFLSLDKVISGVKQGSRRGNALRAEKKALENYLDFIKPGQSFC